MRQMGGVAEWVGRDRELATLTASFQALRRGEGSVVWVEGEPGIGKSALVSRALDAEGDPEWDIGWGTAGPLSERLPLRVMQDCLGVRPGSPDRLRARAAEALQDQRQGLHAASYPPVARIEELLALVDKLCADTPVVVVIDDLHWADDASLIAWHQLAISAGQLPLLLVATVRPTSRPRVRDLRAAVARQGGAVLGLGPLPDADADALVGKVLGAPPGGELRRVAAQAGGNPLYLRELIDALTREQKIRFGPDGAEVSEGLERLSVPLASVLEGRLESVSPDTGTMLRAASLLGCAFAVTDLTVMLGQPAAAVADGVREAMTAGILAESGPALSFRHPLLRQALYESMPGALRSALHAEGARELASRGADALSVAQQLSLSGCPGEGWARSWLETAVPELTVRAPRLAADLLRREADECAADDPFRDELMAGLVRALLAAGFHDEAMSRASRVLTEITDPVRLAEMYAVLAQVQASSGQNATAVATLREALSRLDLPPGWRSRILSLTSMLARAESGDVAAAEAAGGEALSVAAATGDRFATSQALLARWLTRSVRRDHAAALDCAEQAVRVAGDDPVHADVRSLAHDARVFTLQNLARWADAGEALRDATRADQRDKSPARRTGGTAAVYWYWTGQWDDALAELDLDHPDWVPGLDYTHMREGWPQLLVHGVTALIAGRRDQRTTAGRHLRQGLAVRVQEFVVRENREFLVAAQALALEQSGDTRQAMNILAGFAHRHDGELTMTYQWLPDLTRLAVSAGDQALARSAVQACAAEAAAETSPGRAAVASLRCQGLLRSDPDPLREAAERFRETGPAVELPAALEDLAAVLAEKGDEGEARVTLNEAVALYESFGAYWDVRRADGRLRPFGIRRGARGPRGPRGLRPASGWEALTPTEVKVAALIGAGRSTSDIADGMFLSRRTVQKHVSNILAKLGARSRVEIVREALSQGVTA